MDAPCPTGELEDETKDALLNIMINFGAAS